MKKSILLALLVVVFFAGIPAQEVQAAPNITAQAAIVMDFHTGEILFARDIHTPRPPASMTKTMTAFVVYEEIAAGRLTLDTMIPVSENAARISDDPNIQGRPLRLTAGTSISVETLLLLMMPPSSNGAPVVIAEYISGTEEAFAELMNEHARALGMFAEFTNSHGAINHYSTAYSMAVLIRAFVHRHPDILRIASTPYVMFEGVRHSSTNRFFTTEPFPGVDGMKTGTTREAGFCVSATAYRDGRRIITVNMASASNPARYSDARALIEFGFAEAARRVRVTLDGTPLQFEVPAQIIDNRVMVPMRGIFEALGTTVQWDEASGAIVSHTVDGDIITLAIGSSVAFVNDIAFSLDAPPQIVDGRTLVPLWFAAEATGRTANWNPYSRTATIQLPLTPFFPLPEPVILNEYEIDVEYTVEIDYEPIDEYPVEIDYELIDEYAAEIDYEPIDEYPTEIDYESNIEIY